MLFTLCYVFFFIALFASFTLNYVHYMHMFQLNSYSPAEQMKWVKENISDIVWRHLGAVFAAVVIFMVEFDNSKSALIAGLALCIFLAFAMPKKAKKKLVFTPRVIRMCVTSAVVYGAVCVLTVIFGFFTFIPAIVFPLLQISSLFMPIIANFINKPIEKAVNNHYINDAKRIISELPNLNVIGITGSYGKTSTKFYLQKLLSARYNVLMTPESYNTTMGVVKTVRGSLNATYDIFICEMGAKGVGEIKEICDIVHPRHSVITSIGPQHLETFKSLDNIIKTKFEISDCITDGMTFLNYDNEYIRNHQTDKIRIGYGIGEGNGKEYYADEISVSAKGTTFTLHHEDERVCFTTRLIGEHNVQNIVGAIAVANKMGIPLAELVMPVKRLECVPHRLQIIDRGATTIIDDAFNSNPSGAKAALDTLKVFDGVKVLVTPGMIELGEKEFELNKSFGMQAADAADYCVLVGEKQAVPIKEGLLEKGYPEDKISVVKSLSDGLAIVDSIKTEGRKKIVLLENDLPDNY